MATFTIEDLVNGCIAGNVSVHRAAVATASTEFNLKTETAIVDFIADGGLEKPIHANTERWRNNPDPTSPIDVYSYDFHSGTKHGYIAFMFQPKTQKWLVKSFKLNDKSSPLHFPFAHLEKLLKKGDE